jgi:hypothetical protein
MAVVGRRFVLGLFAVTACCVGGVLSEGAVSCGVVNGTDWSDESIYRSFGNITKLEIWYDLDHVRGVRVCFFKHTFYWYLGEQYKQRLLVCLY